MLTIVESVRKVVEVVMAGRVTAMPTESTDYEVAWQRAKAFALVAADYLVARVGDPVAGVTLTHDEWRAVRAIFAIHDGGDEAQEVGGLQEAVQALSEALRRIVVPGEVEAERMVKRLTWLLEGWAAGMQY
jgi:hypothetical protein